MFTLTPILADFSDVFPTVPFYNQLKRFGISESAALKISMYGMKCDLEHLQEALVILQDSIHGMKLEVLTLQNKHFIITISCDDLDLRADFKNLLNE